MKIAFILYDGFSTYDFASLYEPLTQLKAMHLQPDLTWQLCAIQPTVTDALGLPYQATQISPSLDEFDLVVLPGGRVSETLLADTGLLEWLSGAGQTAWLAAVGEGALLLAAAGLLKDKRVAAAQPNLDRLSALGAQPQEQALVEHDAIFSAAGSGAALELGLSLCAQLAGLGAAGQVRNRMGAADNAFFTQPGADNSTAAGQALSSAEGVRYARVSRKTRETEIELELDLDGTGEQDIQTGLPFLDHMLAQIAAHGLFDIDLKAQGDLHIDPHHTVEDVALALGESFRLALGDRRGIVRIASAICPMDETLANVTIDFSGRPYAVIQVEWSTPSTGGIPVTLFEHFLESFAVQARCNLHARVDYGRDDHHKVEALFKALGRALDAATRLDDRRAGLVPSTKGVIFS